MVLAGPFNHFPSSINCYLSVWFGRKTGRKNTLFFLFFFLGLKMSGGFGLHGGGGGSKENKG